MNKPLLEKARRGEPITMQDKIGTIGCMAEMAGFEAEIRARGTWLSIGDLAAIARRKVELKRQEGPR